MSKPAYRLLSTLSQRHIEELHHLYQGEWWTRGRSLEQTRRVVENSDLIFAVTDPSQDRLIAFARVLTDWVFKALIFDVIVAPGHRDTGLGLRLMDHVVQCPELRSVRHIELYCLPEVVPFYEKWGFSTAVAGVVFMRKNND